MLISRFSEHATDDQIAAFSDMLGVELPPKLQLFLKKYMHTFHQTKGVRTRFTLTPLFSLLQVGFK